MASARSAVAQAGSIAAFLVAFVAYVAVLSVGTVASRLLGRLRALRSPPEAPAGHARSEA